MSGHFIKKCRACGTVLGQCRCPAPGKTIEWGECSKYPECAQRSTALTAEVERLKAELATRTERGDQMLKEANEDFLRESAENARLKAELAHQDDNHNVSMESEREQLRELREAAEAHVRVCSTTGGTWLEAVLAKVSP